MLDAREDIRYFRAHEQRIITQAIRRYLTNDAFSESNHRVCLDENPIAPWELRLDAYRIFYHPDAEKIDTITIVAVGYKVHNQLYIRGKRVQL